jgi:hypothetical protein
MVKTSWHTARQRVNASAVMDVTWLMGKKQTHS